MPRVHAGLAWVAAVIPWLSSAAEVAHFIPDTDASRISWTQLDSVLGPPPDVRGKRFGVILKTLTNEYWRLMAAGYRRRAAQDGLKLDIQAAESESDSVRQLAMMENMIGGRYAGLLISPQSASNLQPAIDDAAEARTPIIDVDGAVVDSVTHFVGAKNYTMGVKVAQWFLKNMPAGGKVAVIEGLPGVFSTVQRTAGFRDALQASKKFEIVASVSGRWESQLSYDEALEILRRSPDLVGIYCNNDTMALGVVEAVKSLHLLRQVRVFGTDGTRGAYASIEAGELTGTVDIFPMLSADIGLDVVERLTVGQRIPRVVETPQALVTRENITRYQGPYEAVKKALRADVDVIR
jgi:ribose transport system substrate-binding protein